MTLAHEKNEPESFKDGAGRVKGKETTSVEVPQAL